MAWGGIASGAGRIPGKEYGISNTPWGREVIQWQAGHWVNDLVPQI